MKTLILTTILLVLPWTVSAECWNDSIVKAAATSGLKVKATHDSTTVQLHISADALMIRMPSNHWFVLVEDSAPYYGGRGHGIFFNGTPIKDDRIPLYYIRNLTLKAIDSIPNTDSSIVYINWEGVTTGVSIQNDSKSGAAFWKEEDK